MCFDIISVLGILVHQHLKHNTQCFSFEKG